MYFKETVRSICGSAALILGLTVAGFAEEVVLKATTQLPANSGVVKEIWEPWAAAVNKAGAGVVRVELSYGGTLANFGNVYDRVEADVLQIGWMLPLLVGGRFPLVEATSLPVGDYDGEILSGAFWRLVESGMLNEELGDVLPLWVGVAGSGTPIHFAEPINDPLNLSGRTINVAGARFQSEAISALGATPSSLSSQDLYEALQRGVIDGAMLGWQGFGAFKMEEVASYHMEMPLGSYNHIFFMKRSKFESLPAEAQRILKEHSGLEQSQRFGAFMDDEAAQYSETILALEGHDSGSLDSAQSEKLNSILEPIRQSWTSQVEGRQKILEAYQRFAQDEANGAK